MVSPRLSTLKIRVDHLVFGALALALVVGGLWLWRANRVENEKQDQLDTGLERMRGRTGSSARLWDDAEDKRFVRTYHRSSTRIEEGEGQVVHQPPPQTDPGDLDANEAVDAYQSVLRDLEAAIDEDRILSEREQAELYNRASGSLTALSAWADPNDPADRALMNDAYLQLKSLMGELQIKPPAVDPDAPPAPR